MAEWAVPRLALPSSRRLAAELVLLVSTGLIVSFLAPFDSSERPLGWRLAYWLSAMIGGGLIGIAVDEAVRRRVSHFWLRLALVCVLMTPLVAIFVVVLASAMSGASLHSFNPPRLLFEVLLLCVATMTLRQFALGKAPVVVTVERPEAPDPTRTFRRRLSARRREARLIAVEAEDHYLRVHTDAGSELVTARFADALDELAEAPGFRTHRSWWVAARAIEDVRWRRGAGEARLTGGLTVPVSRSNVAALKAAGWR
jgi:hypothetical protein